MADITTRLWQGYCGKRSVLTRVTTLIVELDIVECPDEEGLQWVDVDIVFEEPRKNWTDVSNRILWQWKEVRKLSGKI